MLELGLGGVGGCQKRPLPLLATDAARKALHNDPDLGMPAPTLLVLVQHAAFITGGTAHQGSLTDTSLPISISLVAS